jgi:hypothetical protein
MKGVMKAALAVGVMVLTTSMVSAQAPQGAPAPAAGGGQGRPGGAPPAPLKNLKVFPQGTTQAQILPTMRAFESALQVECGYCHQWTGQGNPTNDFSVDVKPQKEIARAMMRMVNAANDAIKAAVPATGVRTAAQVQQITCATCHRGEPIPQVPTYQVPAAGTGKQPPPPPAAAPAPAR